jgi:hypothetical protein
MKCLHEQDSHKIAYFMLSRKSNELCDMFIINTTLYLDLIFTIGILGFDSRWGPGIFLFTTASRTALGPTQPPIQWVPGALSLGIKMPGREADH